MNNMNYARTSPSAAAAGPRVPCPTSRASGTSRTNIRLLCITAYYSILYYSTQCYVVLIMLSVIIQCYSTLYYMLLCYSVIFAPPPPPPQVPREQGLDEGAGGAERPAGHRERPARQ